MRTSMPTTCHTAKKQKLAHNEGEREHLPHLIPRLFMPVNQKYLQDFCEQSMQNICVLYGIAPENSTVRAVIQCLSEQVSFTDILCIFFVLLNIDMTTKERMMTSETEAQQQKLANFFMNLRRHLVSNFMSKSECTACMFVTSCQDAWSVA